MTRYFGAMIATDFLGWATFALAVVTSLAAIATAFAAWWTRRAARATENLAKEATAETRAAEAQAKETARLVQASIRPWITAASATVLIETWPDEQNPAAGQVSLNLRNVGQGLALFVP
jgi:Flp pilus assembly protein TadB